MEVFMSKLYKAMIENIYLRDGVGLKDDILNALMTKKERNLSDPKKSPLSRAFLVNVNETLGSGFMLTAQTTFQKEQWELKSALKEEIKFVNDNSPSRFGKNRKNDLYGALCDKLRATHPEYPEFVFDSLNKYKEKDGDFIAKLVCALIESKTSMSQQNDLNTDDNKSIMPKVEMELLKYAYAYAQEHQNIKHETVSEDIYRMLDIESNTEAQKCLRNLAINNLLSLSLPSYSVSQNVNFGDNSLVTIYPYGQQVYLFTKQDKASFAEPDKEKITDLIKADQLTKPDGTPMTDSDGKQVLYTKNLQSALERIKEKLDKNLSEDKKFYVASLAYLLLADKVGFTDPQNFIGIALADPMIDLGLTKDETETLRDAAHTVANEISTNELSSGIDLPLDPSIAPVVPSVTPPTPQATPLAFKKFEKLVGSVKSPLLKVIDATYELFLPPNILKTIKQDKQTLKDCIEIYETSTDPKERKAAQKAIYKIQDKYGLSPTAIDSSMLKILEKYGVKGSEEEVTKEISKTAPNLTIKRRARKKKDSSGNIVSIPASTIYLDGLLPQLEKIENQYKSTQSFWESIQNPLRPAIKNYKKEVEANKTKPDSEKKEEVDILLEQLNNFAKNIQNKKVKEVDDKNLADYEYVVQFITKHYDTIMTADELTQKEIKKLLKEYLKTVKLPKEGALQVAVKPKDRDAYVEK